jgi:DNA-binding NarL/FixJ family response regulator
MFFIPDASSNVEEHVISKVFLESFLETLTEQERKLLELRRQGYTWAEIAQRLGYASHSGVLKRVDSIMKRYYEYGGARAAQP